MEHKRRRADRTHDKACAGRGELDVVRDEDDGTALEERSLEALLVDVRGSVRVDGGKDVVEEEDASAGVDRTSERDACLLTAGKVDALLADLGTVAVLEDRQIARQAARREGLLVPLLTERQAEEDVVPHAIVHEPRLLWDEGGVRGRVPVCVREVGVPVERREGDGGRRRARAVDRAGEDVDLAEEGCTIEALVISLRPYDEHNE